jgi:NAD(P)-dependent dehydrogenase (short-subunit alcohol dehydrogenase family)
MPNELSGKIAIVTGGASGIGAGTVHRFLEEGARVVIADVDRDAGESLAASLGPETAFKQADVSEPNQVVALVDFAVATFGGLNVMFNNAGINGVRRPSLAEEDFSDFYRMMGINMLGVMVGTREAARQMRSSGGGSIINTTSIGGIRPAPGLWSYHASKAGVIMFSQSAAIELGRDGIRVNCIAPANIETPILEGAMTAGVSPERRAEFMAALREFIVELQPLRRQGRPDDIADAAVYFAADRSSYVTGTVLPVDGGNLAGAPPSNSNALAELKRRFM